jgi:hypothetical protein
VAVGYDKLCPVESVQLLKHKTTHWAASFRHSDGKPAILSFK